MAVRRSLSVSISVSEQVAALRDDFTRLLFTWMIPHADDYGVLPGSPAKLKALVVPMLDVTAEQVATALADIEHNELIWRYTEENGRSWLQFRTFEQHQQGLHKRTMPKAPRYCDVVGEPGRMLALRTHLPGSSRKLPEVPSEEKRSETKRREEHIFVPSRDAAPPTEADDECSSVAADADDDDVAPSASVPSVPSGGSAATMSAPDPTPLKRPVFGDGSQPMGLAVYLRDAILNAKPDAKVPRGAKELQGWARHCDLLLRADHREVGRCREVIDYATTDSFWRTVILSAESFRRKFDALDAQQRRRAEQSSLGSADSGSVNGGGSGGASGGGGSGRRDRSVHRGTAASVGRAAPRGVSTADELLAYKRGLAAVAGS